MTTPIHWSLHRLPFRTAWESRRGTRTERWSLVAALAAGGSLALGEAPLPLDTTDPIALASGAVNVAPPASGLEPGRSWRALDAAPGWVRHGVMSALLVQDAMLTHRPLSVSLAARFTESRARDLESVVVNGNVGPHTPEKAAAAALRLVEEGFRVLKVKSLGDAPADAKRLKEIRDIIGSEAALRLDANGAWKIEPALRALTMLHRYELEYVEQPLPVESVDEDARRVMQKGGVPVAWDESVTDRGAAARLARAGAAALVVKPPRTGGPDLAVGIIEAAREEGVACVVSTPLEGAVGRTVDLHLAVLAGKQFAHGLATERILERDLATPAPRAERGRIVVPQGPGLGQFTLEPGVPFATEARP